MRPVTPLAGRERLDTRGSTTRQTRGGCYEVSGTRVFPLPDDRGNAVGLARWRERQADLSAESGAIIHLDRHLTAEERGLFLAMLRELETVGETVTRLEAQSALPSEPAPRAT